MKRWLATAWEASVLKIAAGAGLGAVLSWLLTSGVHPLIVAVGAAVIPVLVNALNGDDPRYGLGKQPHYADIANNHEIEMDHDA